MQQLFSCWTYVRHGVIVLVFQSHLRVSSYSLTLLSFCYFPPFFFVGAMSGQLLTTFSLPHVLALLQPTPLHAHVGSSLHTHAGSLCLLRWVIFIPTIAHPDLRWIYAHSESLSYVISLITPHCPLVLISLSHESYSHCLYFRRRTKPRLSTLHERKKEYASCRLSQEILYCT